MRRVLLVVSILVSGGVGCDGDSDPCPTGGTGSLHIEVSGQRGWRIAEHSATGVGKLVMPMIGAANRDPRKFRDADLFDITRDSNPHIAFGHGIHFCIGREALHVHGPTCLPIRLSV